MALYKFTSLWNYNYCVPLQYRNRNILRVIMKLVVDSITRYVWCKWTICAYYNAFGINSYIHALKFHSNPTGCGDGTRPQYSSCRVCTAGVKFTDDPTCSDLQCPQGSDVDYNCILKWGRCVKTTAGNKSIVSYLNELL